MSPDERGARLRTERLDLDPVRRDDADELLDFFNEPEVGRYLLDGQRVDAAWVTEEIDASERRFDDGSAGLWAVRERGHAGVRGIVGFRPFFDPPELQLLYALRPSAWGRGLAVEAAEAAVRHAFERLGLEDVRAATDEPNTASVRVMERLGMTRTRTAKGAPYATLFYAVSADAWRNRG